jgi:hypothetical protein
MMIMIAKKMQKTSKQKGSLLCSGLETILFNRTEIGSCSAFRQSGCAVKTAQSASA